MPATAARTEKPLDVVFRAGVAQMLQRPRRRSASPERCRTSSRLVPSCSSRVPSRRAGPRPLHQQADEHRRILRADVRRGRIRQRALHQFGIGEEMTARPGTDSGLACARAVLSCAPGTARTVRRLPRWPRAAAWCRRCSDAARCVTRDVKVGQAARFAQHIRIASGVSQREDHRRTEALDVFRFARSRRPAETLHQRAQRLAHPALERRARRLIHEPLGDVVDARQRGRDRGAQLAVRPADSTTTEYPRCSARRVRTSAQTSSRSVVCSSGVSSPLRAASPSARRPSASYDVR